MSKVNMDTINMETIEEIHAVYKYLLDRVAANVDSAAVLTLAYMVEKHGAPMTKVVQKNIKSTGMKE